MAVAEFSVVPVVEGSLRRYVKTALEVVRESGLKYEVGAMGTTIEGDYEELMAVITAARQAVLDVGADRVITSIKVDERVGGLSIEGKLDGLR